MKAILVIDVDDNTEIEFYDVRVWLYNKTTGLDKLYQNVQLKPLPQKKYAVQGMKGYSSTVKECKGYNKCIDEILGEEE